MILLLLLACGDIDEPAGAADTGAADTGAAPAVAPVYSLGACPEIETGSPWFATGDTEYRVKFVLPPDPQGAPVLFAWHWLGGSAGDLVRTMGLDELAEEEGVIVVAPSSDGSTFEWHFLDAPEDNPDLLLFEDLLACLYDQFQVDLDRIHATGMSAGGLQTSYLTMHAAQWLASTAPLSGGVVEGLYSEPAWPLPVLLTWGGPSDESNGLSFHDAALLLSEELRADGSFVVECEHQGGHTIPAGATETVWRFLSDHPRGLAAEPYAAGLPDAFPSYCRIP